MPIGILCLLLVYAIYTKNRTKSKKLVIVAFIFLYIFSNPILINELLLWWEIPPTSISTVKTYDVGIILTGGTTNDDKLPQENIFLGKSADRIAQTIELYKKRKINKILISGGEISVLGKTPKKEIEEITKYMIISGVLKENIFLEAHSQNTRENALNCSRILKKHFKNQSYLLITSGFHLRRANACFEKVGVKVDTFGANYLSHERNYYWYNMLPKEDYLAYSQLIFREIIGYCTYTAMGWI
ncbi:MAG: YdcF family protein [Emticicia sp.]